MICFSFLSAERKGLGNRVRLQKKELDMVEGLKSRGLGRVVWSLAWVQGFHSSIQVYGLSP